MFSVCDDPDKLRNVGIVIWADRFFCKIDLIIFLSLQFGGLQWPTSSKLNHIPLSRVLFTLPLAVPFRVGSWGRPLAVLVAFTGVLYLHSFLYVQLLFLLSLPLDARGGCTDTYSVVLRYCLLYVFLVTCSCLHCFQ